jgi:glutamate/tyrosine decarboxylase-like PLP-dependent enzyme
LNTRELLAQTASRVSDYLDGLERRRVFPEPTDIAALDALVECFPETETPADEVLALLDDVGSPATIGSAGGRYHGFVIGGTLPASLAANWLASGWDQNAGSVVMSPVATKVEQIASDWVLDALGLPAACGVGFVTGATMANFVALAAARHNLLGRLGWDVESHGLFGAPPIQVVVGAEVHVSLLKALALLGLGMDRVERVPVDAQGRMRTDCLPVLSGPALVCIQAGNVNSGAFDPATELCEWAHEHDAWVHADAAFGLWARACPSRAHLADGFDLADSWATDAHKWLNTPYDCGLAVCRDPTSIPPAMLVTASYLLTGEEREPYAYTPEMSRRARGIEVWAALKSLGRSGLAALIERNCTHANRFAERLRSAGFEILNDVVLNQVLVAFGSDTQTSLIIDAIQRDGTCWCGGTEWRGRRAMRISVSSWATSDEDVERSVQAMIRIAGSVLEDSGDGRQP